MRVIAIPMVVSKKWRKKTGGIGNRGKNRDQTDPCIVNFG